MGQYVYKLFGSMSDEDKANLDQAITAVWNLYDITQIPESQINELSELLLDFELLRGWTGVSIATACSFSDGRNQAYYCVPVMDRIVEGVGAKGGHYRYQLNEAYQLFLFDLEEDLGHILMRPETINEKVAEWFRDIDIDFKLHPEFSKKYFALSQTSDDERTLRKKVKGKMLDVIAEYPDLRIEFKDRKAVVLTGRRVNPRDILLLSKFVFHVMRTI